jgi:hypothetical protein
LAQILLAQSHYSIEKLSSVFIEWLESQLKNPILSKESIEQIKQYSVLVCQKAKNESKLFVEIKQLSEEKLMKAKDSLNLNEKLMIQELLEKCFGVQEQKSFILKVEKLIRENFETFDLLPQNDELESLESLMNTLTNLSNNYNQFVCLHSILKEWISSYSDHIEAFRRLWINLLTRISTSDNLEALLIVKDLPPCSPLTEEV